MVGDHPVAFRQLGGIRRAGGRFDQGVERHVVAQHAIPRPGAPRTTRLSGGPAEAAPARGCRFRLRCHLAIPRCAEEEPELATLAAGHAVACHRAET